MIRRLPSFRGLLPFALIALVGACDVTGAPAASIGSTEISHERLATDADLYRFLTGLSGAPCGSPIAGESAASACVRFALSNDIREELVRTYAAANGVAVEPDVVTSAIGQVEQNLGGPAELDARLRDEGLTRIDLEALAARLLLYNEAQAAIVEERLDEATLQGLYEQAIPQLTTVEVAHILLATREDADEVAATVTAENFARLARDRSTDTGSAPSGGNLGMYSESQFRTQFDPTFVDAALALEPGQISGVVETQFGFHVIHLIRRDVAPFEDVRDQLVAQQRESVFREWVLERLGDVEVDVDPRYGRLDLASGDVVPVRSTADSPEAAPTGPSNTAP